MKGTAPPKVRPLPLQRNVSGHQFLNVRALHDLLYKIRRKFDASRSFPHPPNLIHAHNGCASLVALRATSLAAEGASSLSLTTLHTRKTRGRLRVYHIAQAQYIIPRSGISCARRAYIICTAGATYSRSLLLAFAHRESGANISNARRAYIELRHRRNISSRRRRHIECA